MTEVAGRTAFITGGANGIGLGIARSFARAGAKLALVDIDETALEAAKAELSALTDVETAVLDMRDRPSFVVVADRIEAKLGPVSLVVNNAGIAGGAAAHKLNYDLWDWGLGVNLDGVVSGVQTFLPRMVERGGGGHIVNTASGAGLVASASGVLYHTAKFAVVGMSEALALELAPREIGVSVLCPGPVATGIIARTRTMQPRAADTRTEAQRAAARAQSAHMAKLLDEGVSPDAVGEMVLDAVAHDRLYIHTDRSMASLIEARCKALLDAMPADTGRDTTNVFAEGFQG